MKGNPRQPPHSSPSAYKQAFVRTVLSLEGVMGTPTDAQMAGALHTLRQYGTRVAEARALDLDDEAGWLKGRMPAQAAVQHAFVFVKFDSVLNSTLAQNTALHHWIAHGRNY
jgi:hypothetical protein